MYARIIIGILLPAILKDMTGAVTVVSDDRIIMAGMTTMVEEEIIPASIEEMIIQDLKEEIIM